MIARRAPHPTRLPIQLGRHLAQMGHKTCGLPPELASKVQGQRNPSVQKNFSVGYFCGSLCPTFGLPLRCNVFHSLKELSPMKSICPKICTVIFGTFLAATIVSSAFATPGSPFPPLPPPTTGGGSVAALDTPGSPFPPLPPPTTGGGSVAALDTPGSPFPPLPPPTTGGGSVASLDTPGSPFPPLPPPTTGGGSVA